MAYINSIFNKYKNFIEPLFDFVTPLIKLIRPYWTSIVNDKNQFYKDIDTFSTNSSNDLFIKIKNQFTSLHRDAVDFYTCEMIVAEANNNNKNFILYFGYDHIDNIIRILTDIYRTFPIEKLQTQHKENNRCLDLKITNFDDLLSNSFNAKNIIGGKKPKKYKNKIEVPITIPSKAHIRDFISNVLHKPNPDRPASLYN